MRRASMQNEWGDFGPFAALFKRSVSHSAFFLGGASTCYRHNSAHAPRMEGVGHSEVLAASLFSSVKR